MRVTNASPLGCSLLLSVGTVNSVQTLKDGTDDTQLFLTATLAGRVLSPFNHGFCRVRVCPIGWWRGWCSVVTGAFHLPRAIGIQDVAGVEARPSM
jgi:hypothetical protein